MNKLHIFVVLVLLESIYAANTDAIEKKIRDRMHIPEDEVARIGQKKKLLEQIEETNVENKEPIPEIEVKEDSNLPEEPSETNPHVEATNALEGDEMITEKQLDKKIENAMEEHRRRQRRQFQPYEEQMWQLDLDYYVDPSLKAEIVPKVRKAMDWINENTCFVMKEVRSKSQARKPYITFMDGTWCQSFVGKVMKDEQVIEMVPACGRMGTVIHEFLHALGFHHEQSRQDRDQFVRIDKHNIKQSAQRNFEPAKGSKQFDTPYIFGSLMAYTGTAFSMNGKATIVANDQKYQRTMGHRVFGTFADARRINTAYKCMDRCPRGPNCKNGGFRHPKNCNRCLCPEAFTGATCTDLRPSIDPSGKNAGCGGVIHVKEIENRYVLAVNADRVPEAHYCTTEFKAPRGKVVRIRMAKEAGDKVSCSMGCNWGFIELNPGSRTNDGTRDYGLPGYRDCCIDQMQTSAIVTDTDRLIATAFAREYKTQLTVYVTAVRPGNTGPVETTKLPTSATTTRPTARPEPRPTTSGGDRPILISNGKDTYKFRSLHIYKDYLACVGVCRDFADEYGSEWSMYCHKNCLRRHAEKQ